MEGRSWQRRACFVQERSVAAVSDGFGSSVYGRVWCVAAVKKSSVELRIGMAIRFRNG